MAASFAPREPLSTGPGVSPRRWARAGSAALLAMLAAAVCAQEAGGDKDAKAACLAKLAPFVDWPPSVFESADTPVTICVLGDQALGAALERVVVGRRRGDRPIAAKRLERAGADEGCQILYVAGSREQVSTALRRVEGAPVLTVTESATGGPRGMVNLVFQDHRIRFEIDEEAASESGVTISAKLLELALTVRRRS